ncbi:MAG: hybrid-cluster NAD(P)-dependent oxidoreductase [Ectothiorhodospiraceae bacterium]|jgi:ferredoxin-NADP reductase
MSREYINPVNTQVWAYGRHQVRCVKVIHETWDTRTFNFMAEEPLMFFFKPGQFVTLELNIDGAQVMRSYTISSSPSIPYSFSITVKRIPGGLVSNWLHDHLKEGDTVAVHGPAGNFNCIDHSAEKVLLLSGGVGITPVMSMARWWFDTNADVDIAFVHSARTPRDVIFERELEHMDSRISNFNLSVVCERKEIGQTWAGYRGFVNEAMLNLIAPDFMEREIFCCGPAPYMRAIRDVLRANGFPMEHYHQESFAATPADNVVEAEEMSRQAKIEEEDQELGYNVEFATTGMSVRSVPEETVHAVASRGGIFIPKACGMGICGTCKVMKKSGEVEMSHNGGITDEDVEAGYILSCCSVPKSDVVVDY